MDQETWVRIKPFVRRWQNMMDRCYDPECSAFRNYGGRGIKVCPEWHDPYVYVSQLPSGYFPKAHLDRIDNDGDYEPSNVRWLTARENHQNRRTSKPITYNGRTQTLSAWARELGVSRAMLDARLSDHGWAVEKAFSTPSMGPHERMKIARETRLDRMKQERGLSDDQPYVTKRSLIPKRVERRVEYQGAMHTINQLSERTGVTSKKLRKRILERGWDFERAIEAG